MIDEVHVVDPVNKRTLWRRRRRGEESKEEEEEDGLGIGPGGSQEVL